MTVEKKEDQELLIISNTLNIEYRFDAGQYMGRFLTELRDRKRIWANQCPQCGRFSCPPRAFCGQCLGVEMTDWVEQGDEGVLAGFDIHYYEFEHPRSGEVQPVPWADGLIQLNGGAHMLHQVVPPDPEKLKVGDRYQAVWKEEGRTGEVFDILHFEKKEETKPSQKTFPKKVALPELKELHSVQGNLTAHYQHSAGARASEFFVKLRDDQKITATRCAQCDKTYMPPASICSHCFDKLDEWVELSGRGEVVSYTVIHYDEPAHPLPAPFASAIVRLEGADTGITHFLGEVHLDKITIGMKVEPVFKDEREGNMLDIQYFRPVL